MPLRFQASVRELLTQRLQLTHGNAQPGSIGADFGRFGVDFWTEVKRNSNRNEARKTLLEDLNGWRNAIAHQDLGGRGTLHLTRVKQWRRACQGLAKSFDEVVRHHLQTLTGTSPW